MCGRFTLKETPKQLAGHFQLEGDLDYQPSWNIAPSNRLCTITANQEGSRHLRNMRWGFIPTWAKGKLLTNARGETVSEKNSYKTAFKSRRCIIPASGFYEWATENGLKNPWYFSLKSGDPMAFAGLWETSYPKEGEAIETCCIITIAANALMEPIHDRMPVILHPEHWNVWLSLAEHQPDRLLPMIQPYEAETMQAWPVTRELNKVGLRNDAGLAAPLKDNS